MSVMAPAVRLQHVSLPMDKPAPWMETAETAAPVNAPMRAVQPGSAATPIVSATLPTGQTLALAPLRTAQIRITIALGSSLVMVLVIATAWPRG